MSLRGGGFSPTKQSVILPVFGERRNNLPPRKAFLYFIDRLLRFARNDIAFVLIALAAPAAYGAENTFSGDTLTLEQTVRLALQNSADALIAEQDVIIAQQRAREAKFLFLPQPSVGGSITKSNLNYPLILSPELGLQYIEPSSFENFYAARAMLVQTIYAGGRNKNTYRLAQAGLKQAKSRYEAAKRDIALNAKNAFFRLMHSKEREQSANGWLKNMEEMSARIKSAGWGEVESRVIMDKMRSEAADAAQGLKMARLEFLKSLNKELSAQVDISGEFKPSALNINEAKAIVWAMELRPELKSEIYKAEMDAIAVNLAMSRRSPTVMLGAAYDVVGNKFPLRANSWQATLSVQFPLTYDFWTQITQKKAEQRQGDLKRSEMQDKVRLEVRQAYETLIFWQKEAEERFISYSNIRGLYEKNVKHLSAGPDALRAGFAVYEAQIAHLSAVREQLDAKAKLEWALGRDLSAE